LIAETITINHGYLLKSMFNEKISILLIGGNATEITYDRRYLEDCFMMCVCGCAAAGDRNPTKYKIENFDHLRRH
jgi:hypothetical protein